MPSNAGYHLFNTGDVLTAAQVQYNLQNQSIMFFATAAARDTDLTGVLQEGMFAYLADTNTTVFYNGTSWQSLFTGQTLTSPKEVYTQSAGTAGSPATVNLDVSTSAVLIYTGTAAADWTLNVRGDASTTLNSLMAVNEQISVVFETPIGATAYEPVVGGFTIDGVVDTITALSLSYNTTTEEWSFTPTTTLTTSQSLVVSLTSVAVADIAQIGTRYYKGTTSAITPVA